MLRFGPLGWFCRTTTGLIPNTVMGVVARLRTTDFVAVWVVDVEGRDRLQQTVNLDRLAFAY